MSLWRRWSVEEERLLYDGYIAGRTLDDMATESDRKPSALRARLQRLGLCDEAGHGIQPAPAFQPTARVVNRLSGLPRTPEPPCVADPERLALRALSLKAHLIEKLEAHGYMNCRALALASFVDLIAIHAIGPKKCRVIGTALAARGLRLGMSVEELDALRPRPSASIDGSATVHACALCRRPINLPIEQPEEWPEHGCLPLAAWFVAQVGPVLLGHTDRLDALAMLLHLGWGTAEPPMQERAVETRLNLGRHEARRRIAMAARLLSRLVREPGSPLGDAHRVARAMLFNAKGALDRQRLVLISDAMYGPGSSAPAAMLALLAGRTQEFSKLRRVVRNQRGRMRKGHGRPRVELRRTRRWGLLWLGAFLPARLANARTLDAVCAGPARTPSALSVGKTGVLETDKGHGIVAYESNLERRVLAMLDESDEVTEFKAQATAIERLDAPRRYYPDVAVLTRGGIQLVVEVKPVREMASVNVLFKTIAALRYAEQKSCVFALSDHLGRTIADLLHVEVPEAMVTVVKKLLEHQGRLSARDWAAATRRQLPPEGFGDAMLAALALQQDLSLTFLPHFRLERLPNGFSWKSLLKVPASFQHSVGRRSEDVDSLSMRVYR